MKTLLLIFIFLVNGSSFAQTIITLQPGAEEGKDTRIWSVDPLVNYGTHEELRAMTWTWFGSPGSERSLLQFNLANIPQNAEICYATMSLYQNDSTSSQTNSSLSGPNTCLLCRIITAWDENLVTWNSQPSITMTHAVTIPESVLPYEDVPDIDVTDLVADMVADQANSFGFELRLEVEDYYRRRVFATSDNTDSTRHPKLVVCYSMPVEVNEISRPSTLASPNPIIHGELHVTTNMALSVSNEFAIFNNIGIEVYRNSVSNNPDSHGFDVPAEVISTLPAGNYFLFIQSNETGETVIFNKGE